MKILEYEIDCSFVYSVSPIKIEKSRDDAYLIFFNLNLKDGKVHKVVTSYNYDTFNYQGQTFVRNIKPLNKRQIEIVPVRFKKDLSKMAELRKNIVKQMSLK